MAPVSGAAVCVAWRAGPCRAALGPLGSTAGWDYGILQCPESLSLGNGETVCSGCTLPSPQPCAGLPCVHSTSHLSFFRGRPEGREQGSMR